MSREEWSSKGWFYQQAGQTRGPVPTDQLKQLLAAGQLQPRQAVWQKASRSVLFVHAAAAAFGTRGDGTQQPSSQPATA
jgi:hypothetical protein